MYESTLASSRFGGSGGHGGGGGGTTFNIRTAGENGRAQPVLYAKRIKYTKRKGQLVLEPRDKEAIKKFASFPNLIPRLVSMISCLFSGNCSSLVSM
jgi:hypothetical protein